MALARALAVEPRLLLLDEPFGALDANVRAELRSWLRRLHEEVPVTTVLVTHDQEEAMEVADRVVVMNGGRVEQVGAPREVYDAPANEFVMGFLGPVARLQGSLVRPHDVGVTTDPAPGAQEAQVLRVVHLGFEVRLELELGDGSRLPVQLARHEAEALEAAEGDIVWIRGPQAGGRGGLAAQASGEHRIAAAVARRRSARQTPPSAGPTAERTTMPSQLPPGPRSRRSSRPSAGGLGRRRTSSACGAATGRASRCACWASRRSWSCPTRPTCESCSPPRRTSCTRARARGCSSPSSGRTR